MSTYLFIVGLLVAIGLAWRFRRRITGIDYSKRLPIVISLVALTLSGVSLYFSYLEPFAPVVSMGPVIWQPMDGDGRMPGANPATRGPFLKLVLLVPLTISHGGSRPGTVEDVVIRLTRVTLGNGGEWQFEPQIEVDEAAYLTNFDPKGYLKWITAVFRPIPIQKGEQVQKLFLFLGSPAPGRSVSSLSPGRYLLRVLIRTEGSSDFREVLSRVEELSPAVMQDLQHGNRWSPTPESLLEPRRRIQ